MIYGGYVEVATLASGQRVVVREIYTKDVLVIVPRLGLCKQYEKWVKNDLNDKMRWKIFDHGALWPKVELEWVAR